MIGSRETVFLCSGASKSNSRWGKLLLFRDIDEHGISPETPLPHGKVIAIRGLDIFAVTRGSPDKTQESFGILRCLWKTLVETERNNEKVQAFESALAVIVKSTKVTGGCSIVVESAPAVIG